MKGFYRLYQLWNGRKDRISTPSFTSPTWKDWISKQRQNWNGILHARENLSNYDDNGSRNANKKGNLHSCLNSKEDKEPSWELNLKEYIQVQREKKICRWRNMHEASHRSCEVGRQRKFANKVWCTGPSRNSVILLVKPSLFVDVLGLPSSSWVLKLPISSSSSSSSPNGICPLIP